MFETTRQKFDRRTLLAGGVATAALAHLAPAGVFAQEPAMESTAAQRAERRAKLRELGFLWRATSPSIHLGDTFTAVMSNRGQTDLAIYPIIIIMDHATHYNIPVIEEEVTLPVGGQRTFTAMNDYGVANHFSTVMGASTDDPAILGIEITLVDASGVQTAQFNERAFMVESWSDVIERQAEAQMAGGGSHGGHGSSS